VDDDQQLDLIHDASRRLTEMISRPEDRFVALAYDGRSFLSEAGDDDGGCFPKKTFALYDSEGLLHRREHHLLDGASTIFLDSDTVLSLAGRPLAVLNLTPSTSKLTYLTTDHLGTPAAASSESGGLVWNGGFEPFGAAWNVPDSAVFLRFPGQWSDVIWGEMADGLYYNLNRWYGTGIGRYTKPDPQGKNGDAHAYLYAGANPLLFLDLIGEKSRVCCAEIPRLPAATGGGWARGWDADRAKPKEGHKPIPSPCSLP
jgi:RHS repeat-associated protein